MGPTPLSKVCTRCGCLKARGLFRRKGVRWSAQCKECERPGKAARMAKRRLRMKGGGSYTAEEMQGVARRQEWLCAVCRKHLLVVGYHIDHIVPLAKGGSNTIENIQLLCPRCNLAKASKLPGGRGRGV